MIVNIYIEEPPQRVVVLDLDADPLQLSRIGPYNTKPLTAGRCGSILDVFCVIAGKSLQELIPAGPE